jgi:hypothetical protein
MEFVKLERLVTGRPLLYTAIFEIELEEVDWQTSTGAPEDGLAPLLFLPQVSGSLTHTMSEKQGIPNGVSTSLHERTSTCHMLPPQQVQVLYVCLLASPSRRQAEHVTFAGGDEMKQQ